MQFETTLRARVARAQCQDCGVKTAKVPWADKYSRFTLMFEAFAIEALKAGSDIKKICSLLRLHWESAHQIMERAVERGLARRETEEVTSVGIDEKNFRRSQSYVTLLNDLEGGRVLEVVEGRKEKDARKLFASLGEKERSNIQAIAMDMWPAFINAARTELPEADIVFDKFHISQHLNSAVDTVRRKENAQLMKEGVDTLKGSRFSWMKSPGNRTQLQTFYVEGLRKSKLKTARAWAIKELFNGEYWSSYNEAFGEMLYKQWYGWAIRSRIEPIKKVARMIKKHLWGLQNWFQHRITNAVSEGLNSRIQSIKSAARGFRNFANYRTRILFCCGKLDLRPETCH
jgi:transposase